MDITDMPEYQAGIDWADANVDRLRERFTGQNLQTQELRDILWGEALRLYKPQRESMENDLKATAWVSGALKPLAELLEFTKEGFSAAFEMAMEMGSVFGAERAKHEALEDIKTRPNKWWHKKFGEASPNDLMRPMFHKWWREVGEPEHRSKTSRAETLKYVLGAREMMALATIKNATLEGKGSKHVYYDVDGDDVGFQMIAEDAVYPGGIVSQRSGDIVG